MKTTGIRTRTEQLLRIFCLQDSRSTFVQHCSYGMKKKTALAMALLPSPHVLFLDKPFEGIDPVTAETIRRLLRAGSQRGVTVLLTSYIPSLVDRIADQVVMINHGNIVLNTAIANLPRDLEDIYFSK